MELISGRRMVGVGETKAGGAGVARSLLVCALLAVQACSAGLQRAPGEGALEAGGVGIDGQTPPDDSGTLGVAGMLARATPAVVNISVRFRSGQGDGPMRLKPFFRQFFSVPDEGPPLADRGVSSVGSGVIVDGDRGYILTNDHLIAGAQEIRVGLTNGRWFEAIPVGNDPETDLALLAIDAPALRDLDFGDSDRLQVGDAVFAIGNPFGLGQTVTSGIVSAVGRTGLVPGAYEDFIQTDASINPGNSGGALVDRRGRLVGLNAALVAPEGDTIGIGFAISGNIVRTVMRQLLEHGEVRRGRLGLLVQTLTPDLAEAMDLPRGSGALVSQVAPGSPADAAGIERGDLIVELDGEPVRTSGDLRAGVGLLSIGSRIELKILRAGKQRFFRLQTVAR